MISDKSTEASLPIAFDLRRIKDFLSRGQASLIKNVIEQSDTLGRSLEKNLQMILVATGVRAVKMRKFDLNREKQPSGRGGSSLQLGRHTLNYCTTHIVPALVAPDPDRPAHWGAPDPIIPKNAEKMLILVSETIRELNNIYDIEVGHTQKEAHPLVPPGLMQRIQSGAFARDGITSLEFAAAYILKSVPNSDEYIRAFVKALGEARMNTEGVYERIVESFKTVSAQLEQHLHPVAPVYGPIGSEQHTVTACAMA